MLMLCCTLGSASKKEEETGMAENTFKQGRIIEGCSSVNEDLQEPSIGLLRSYFENFTIHGLAKVFIGKRWERFVWFAVLLASVVFVLNATHNFIQQYKAFDILTDIKIKSAAKITLPPVSLCSIDAKGFTCYGNWTIDGNEHCKRKTSLLFPTSNYLYTQLYDEFHKYAILHPVYPDRCMVINPYGNLTTETLPKIGFRQPDQRAAVNMYIHDHADLTIPIADKPTATFKLMDISIILRNKQIIWRLPKPYTSKCSRGGDNSSIFPGPYSITKCRNTCAFNMMRSKCDDVIKQWQIYLPQEIGRIKRETTRQCLLKLFQEKFDPEFSGNIDELECKCPVSCYDTYLDTTVELKFSSLGSISFKYFSNTITEIKERPAYPASQFITDIGGWLSLFTGMSVLSLLEIFIFIVIGVATFWQRCAAGR